MSGRRETDKILNPRQHFAWGGENLEFLRALWRSKHQNCYVVHPSLKFMIMPTEDNRCHTLYLQLSTFTTPHPPSHTVMSRILQLHEYCTKIPEEQIRLPHWSNAEESRENTALHHTKAIFGLKGQSSPLLSNLCAKLSVRKFQNFRCAVNRIGWVNYFVLGKRFSLGMEFSNQLNVIIQYRSRLITKRVRAQNPRCERVFIQVFRRLWYFAMMQVTAVSKVMLKSTATARSPATNIAKHFCCNSVAVHFKETLKALSDWK